MAPSNAALDLEFSLRYLELLEVRSRGSSPWLFDVLKSNINWAKKLPRPWDEHGKIYARFMALLKRFLIRVNNYLFGPVPVTDKGDESEEGEEDDKNDEESDESMESEESEESEEVFEPYLPAGKMALVWFSIIRIEKEIASLLALSAVYKDRIAEKMNAAPAPVGVGDSWANLQFVKGLLKQKEAKKKAKKKRGEGRRRSPLVPDQGDEEQSEEEAQPEAEDPEVEDEEAENKAAEEAKKQERKARRKEWVKLANPKFCMERLDSLELAAGEDNLRLWDHELLQQYPYLVQNQLQNMKFMLQGIIRDVLGVPEQEIEGF